MYNFSVQGKLTGSVHPSLKNTAVLLLQETTEIELRNLTAAQVHAKFHNEQMMTKKKKALDLASSLTKQSIFYKNNKPTSIV